MNLPNGGFTPKPKNTEAPNCPPACRDFIPPPPSPCTSPKSLKTSTLRTTPRSPLRPNPPNAQPRTQQRTSWRPPDFGHHKSTRQILEEIVPPLRVRRLRLRHDQQIKKPQSRKARRQSISTRPRHVPASPAVPRHVEWRLQQRRLRKQHKRTQNPSVTPTIQPLTNRTPQPIPQQQP